MEEGGSSEDDGGKYSRTVAMGISYAILFAFWIGILVIELRTRGG